MMGAPRESVPANWAVPIASVELNHSVICPVAMSNRETVVVPFAAKAMYQIALLFRSYPASELSGPSAGTVKGSECNAPVAGSSNLRFQFGSGPGVEPAGREKSSARMLLLAVGANGGIRFGCVVSRSARLPCASVIQMVKWPE